jgi:hypothetical protein
MWWRPFVARASSTEVLVCDASLVVEQALDRAGDPPTALGEDELVAPPLLWSEVPSVLHELAYRSEITKQLGPTAPGGPRTPLRLRRGS